MTETVFMIHGMWGGAWYWANYRSFFESRGYKCIAPTLPYHDVDPASAPDARLGCTSLLDYADALEATIRQLDEKPILVGHSMGGLLAQILASRCLAKAVVLLAPASPAGVLAMRLSVIRSFLSVATKWRFWREPMRQTFAEVVYAMLHRLPREGQENIYNRLVHESGRALAEIAFWMFDPRHASRVDDTKVTCPMLVVAGSEDRLTPPSVVRRVARKYRGVATYMEFPDHTHWLVGEVGWEDVANYVITWLEPYRSGVAQE